LWVGGEKKGKKENRRHCFPFAVLGAADGERGSKEKKERRNCLASKTSSSVFFLYREKKE